ncbi:MAG: substrate-binding domain-containing protein [Lachnospiraceae bacterium]|nr:substrate-binding domain-containing protein [Lachnospiraceae bacterium]
MKKKVAIGLCLAMVFSLVACGSSSGTTTETAGEEATEDASDVGETEESTEEQHYKIGFSFQDASQPFHTTIRDEIQSIVEANGDTFIYADPAMDQQLQIDQIEDMITQEIDILVLNAVENDGVLPALEACKNAGIPIIAYDARPVDDGYIVSYIASDNVTAGGLIGEYAMEQLEEGSKVGIMYFPYSDSIINRTDGFESTVGDYFEVVRGEVTVGYILETAEDMIQANPDLDAIFGPYEGFSIVAAAAVQAAGLGDTVQVYGVDGSPSEKEAIESGEMTATAAQSPVSIADKTAEVMYQYLAGEEVESEYLLDSFIIDADNVAEYGTDGWQ